MSDEERVTLTPEQAAAMLPDKEYIHTFRQVGLTGMLVGAEWTKADIINHFSKAKRVELSGATATHMGHGLAVEDERGGYLFVETKAVSE